MVYTASGPRKKQMERKMNNELETGCTLSL